MVGGAYPLRYVLNTLEFDFDCRSTEHEASGMIAIHGPRPHTGSVIYAQRGLVPADILRRAVVDGLGLDWDQFRALLERRIQLMD